MIRMNLNMKIIKNKIALVGDIPIVEHLMALPPIAPQLSVVSAAAASSAILPSEQTLVRTEPIEPQAHLKAVMALDAVAAEGALPLLRMVPQRASVRYPRSTVSHEL